MSHFRPWLGFAGLLAGIFFLAPACLQLETPHTFREDEEIRLRAKNLHSYYQELEESIRLEQYHIKLLQDALNIKLTSEQALSEQIDKKQKDIEIKKKDLDALNKDVLDLDTKVKEATVKRQETQAALDAEKKQTGDLEKSIALEAGRIGEARLSMGKTTADLAAIEAEVKASEQAVAEREKTLTELKAKGALLEADLDGRMKEFVAKYLEEMRTKREGSQLEPDELGEVRSNLTQAALGLEKLDQGIKSLQKYYDAKQDLDQDLSTIQSSTKDLLESIRRIQELFDKTGEKEGGS